MVSHRAFRNFLRRRYPELAEAGAVSECRLPQGNHLSSRLLQFRPYLMTPNLPAELQREIFEIAVRLNHQDAALKLNLSLVAQHVRFWVDWVFYEMVTIVGPKSADKFFELVDLKAPGFFAIAVKTLLLSSLPADYAVRVLSFCAGVQSLAFWTWHFPTLALPPISQLPLRRLSVRFCLADIITGAPPPLWLSSLTHIDIAFFRASKSYVEKLGRLPSLTHVALYSAGPPLAEVVCASYPNLRVLVILSDSHITQAATTVACSFDPRIVVTLLPADPIEDWEAQHCGLSDMWTCAERVVAERKALAARSSMEQRIVNVGQVG